MLHFNIYFYIDNIFSTLKSKEKLKKIIHMKFGSATERTTYNEKIH